MFTKLLVDSAGKLKHFYQSRDFIIFVRSLIVYPRKEIQMLNIYDFYDNFSTIYPLDKDSLKNPDRDIFGYYWDFEDYIVGGEIGRGLVLQGIMITCPEDFKFFVGIFQQAFRMTAINAVIRSSFIVNFSDFYSDAEFRDNYSKSIIDTLTKTFDEKIKLMNSFFDMIKIKSKRGKIWISLDQYWTDLIKSDVEIFWGSGISVIRLPLEYSAMNQKYVWEEVHRIGPLEFNPDMAWEDLSYTYPELVKYIDKDILERIDTGFLGNCHKYGII